MPPRGSLVLLGVLVILGLALRAWQAQESLWLDELHTAWCAGGSLPEVAPRAMIGNQSPLFFWLEWLLVQWLGPSEFALRLPSLIAGTLLPAALFGVAWQWTKSAGVGLVAAALLIVDPRSIFFATEARPYALIELFAVLHVAVFAELVERPSAALRIAFVLGAALLFHLHYTAALLMVAELTFLILTWAFGGGESRYRPAQAVVDLLATALLAAPAGWHVLEIAQRRDNWAAFVPQEAVVEIFWLVPWLCAAIVPFAAADLYLRNAMLDAVILPPPEAEPRERRGLLLLCWLLVPVAVAWVLTATDLARLAFPRYVVASAPAAMLLAALLTRLPPWPTIQIFVSLVLILSGVWTSQILPRLAMQERPIVDRTQDWRAAVGFLHERLTEQPLPVLIRSGLIEADALRKPHEDLLDDYCRLPLTALYRLHAPPQQIIPVPFTDAGQLDDRARAVVQSHGSVWLVATGRENNALALASQVAESLSTSEVPGSISKVQSQHGNWSTAEHHSFGSVRIFRLAPAR